MIAIASVDPTPVSFSLMRYVLHIHDPTDGVTSTTFVTREQADAIIAMAPGDAVELNDGSAQHLGEAAECDPVIAFISQGVRPSARRSSLVPQLQVIRAGRGVALDG